MITDCFRVMQWMHCIVELMADISLFVLKTDSECCLEGNSEEIGVKRLNLADAFSLSFCYAGNHI